MTEHIVAVYKTEADATAAARSLESLGIPPSAIRQYAEAVHAKAEPVEHTSAHTSGGGFWAWLFGDESMTETTRSMYTDDIYDRRVSSGNVVISLTVDDTKIHETISALEAHNPVDIDEGSEEIAQPGAGMTPPVGLGAGEAMPTEAVGQPGVTGSYPSGRVASASSPEVVSGNATPHRQRLARAKKSSRFRRNSLRSGSARLIAARRLFAGMWLRNRRSRT